MDDLGLSLRRVRRLRGMKQSHAAELLGVSQATVSRWENGAQAPAGDALTALERLLAEPVAADAALRRLVEGAAGPVHLICDATHVLLAASPARAAGWRASVADLFGRTLRPFASPEIADTERKLEALKWPLAAICFWTGANADPDVPIRPGLTLWEPIRLADGRLARLVSTVAEPPAYAALA
jgi:transcriptional regulator with XRE-family HTH domain